MVATWDWSLFSLYGIKNRNAMVIKSKLNCSKRYNVCFNKFKSCAVLRLRRSRCGSIRGMKTPCTYLSRTGNSYKITVLHSCVFLLRAPEPARWPEETCLIFLGPMYSEEPFITKITQVPKVIISVNRILTRFILEVHSHLKSRNHFLQVSRLFSPSTDFFFF